MKELKTTEYALYLQNVIFEARNCTENESPVLAVASLDRAKDDEERYVLNYMSFEEIKRLKDYIDSFIKEIES